MKKAANLTACVVFLAFAAVSAAAMNDPTRPPASFTQAPATMAYAQPLLQSIIIGTVTRAAIIDGERVEIGGRFRDSRVVKIGEDEVVLAEDDGTARVLRMYPDVEKKTAKSRDGATPKPPARSRLP